MKGTDDFKKTIEAALQSMAAADSLFAAKLQNPSKNIDDCITYIMNTVQKSGCCGFTDDEVFGMAAHYYDEENIEIGGPISCNVVVNHKVELSEDEIQKAKQEAREKIMAQEREKLSKKPTPKKPDNDQIQQGTLF